MPENMMKIKLTGLASLKGLLELPKAGVSREDAYKIVQRNAMKVWEDLQQGKKAVIKRERVSSYRSFRG